MQPPVLDSFLQQIRMFLQWIFAGQKTATSSGCVKCIEFRTRVITWYCSEDRHQPLLSKSANLNCRQLKQLVHLKRKHLVKNFEKPFFKSNWIKPSACGAIINGAMWSSLNPVTINNLCSVHYHSGQVCFICATTEHYTNWLFWMLHLFLNSVSASPYDNLVYRE